jgi:hypothetical protein
MDVSSEEMRGRVFETNVSSLGMLGDSIATDVIIMMTRTQTLPTIKMRDTFPAKMASDFSEDMADYYGEMRADLLHVARRLESLVDEEVPDPGKLMDRFAVNLKEHRPKIL